MIRQRKTYLTYCYSSGALSAGEDKIEELRVTL